MQKRINLLLLHMKLGKLDLLAYSIDYPSVCTFSRDFPGAGWFAQSMTEKAGFRTSLSTTVLFAYVSSQEFTRSS